MDDTIFTARWEQWLGMPADLGKWPGSDPELLRPKLEALCRLYLESTTEQRGRLIRLFQSPTPEGHLSRPYAWFENLHDYAIDRIPEIRATCDGGPLYLAIAALALQPEGGDHRDEIMTRDALYDAAVKVGIDPAPYFEEVLAGATHGQRALML